MWLLQSARSAALSQLHERSPLVDIALHPKVGARRISKRVTTPGTMRGADLLFGRFCGWQLCVALQLCITVT
jgi:hypothetical protein